MKKPTLAQAASGPRMRTWCCKHCNGRGRETHPEGGWLREQREGQGLTIRGLARQLGISAAFLCDIEHNRRRPCLAVLLWASAKP